MASLHARLICWLLILLVMVGLTAWASIRHAAENEASRETDSRLEMTATLLQVVVQNSWNDGARNERGAPRPASYTAPDMRPPVGSVWLKRVRFEVATWDNRVLMRTDDFPEALRMSSPGFENRDGLTTTWRVFTRTDERRGITYRVAVTQATREANTIRLNHQFIQPLGWALLVFVIVALLSVRYGLAPLRRVERAIARHDPNDTEPLDIDWHRVPIELRGLVSQLDRLLKRVHDVLIRQRAFTAAAGHELRTPLAGCKAQLQVALRHHDPAGRDRALNNIQRSIDRMSQLVSQLLLLARSDPQAPHRALQDLDLVTFVEEVVASCQERAERDGVSLVFEADSGAITIAGDASLLEAMIVNLIDNAIRFSPDQGEIRVCLNVHDQSVDIRVCDQGPGIPAHEREYVFDPFYSRNDEPRSGSGLGLTIVQAVAKFHQGEATLETAHDEGTEAVVTLPTIS